MTIKGERSTKRKEFLSCRDVLWIAAFCGFCVVSILEFNLSLTIIVMVESHSKPAVSSQCANDGQMTSNSSDLRVNGSPDPNIAKHNITHDPVSSLELTTRSENTTPSPVRHSDRFAWNEYEQGLALGGSYWLHWATQLPGGFLARRYGTKFVFGWSILATALLGVLLPFCARYHLYAFVAIRVLQGFFTGFTIPSMHNMAAKWIPPNERSKFLSCYFGNGVGGAISYLLCGMIIKWFYWDYVFYVTSAFGVIWYVAWYYLAYDTPQEHPRISDAERTYILENLDDSVDYASSQTVPWKAILTSGPVWMTALTFGGVGWGIFTVALEAPTYLYRIHGWDISATSVFSALPHLMPLLFSYVFSSLVDWLLRTKRMSRTNLRKVAVFISHVIQSFLILGLAFSGCHSNLAIVLMIAGNTVIGAFTAGGLANCIDLSPNYASIILGICNVMSVSSGFVVPLIVGILTNNNQTMEQWRLVFLITAAIVFLTGAIYVFFGTSELQPWNGTKDEETTEELKKLRSNAGGMADKNKFG